MKKSKQVTVGSQKLTVRENRLVRLTVKKVKSLKTTFQKQRYYEMVAAMDDGRVKQIILFSTTSVAIIKAKLSMKRGEWDYLAQSQSMLLAQQNNDLTYFTPPFAGLADWKSQNDDFDTALQMIQNGKKGGTGEKKRTWGKLKGTLNKALGYINGLCTDNQEKAEAIIGAALMQMTNTKSNVTSDITVTNGKDAFTLIVKCPAAKIDGKPVVATYEKSYSADGGATWTALLSIPRCKIQTPVLVANLPVVCRSRYTTMKEGTTAWVFSKPVTPH